MSTGAKAEQCFIEFVVKASCPEDCAVDCLWQFDVFACRVSGSVCLGFGVLFLFLWFGCFVWVFGLVFLLVFCCCWFFLGFFVGRWVWFGFT